MWRSAVQLCLGLRTAQTRIVPCLPKDIGGLAQLARAPALQAGGQRFESVILHFSLPLLGIQGQRSMTYCTRRNDQTRAIKINEGNVNKVKAKYTFSKSAALHLDSPQGYGERETAASMKGRTVDA